jgi:hypothetical protein
VHGSNLAEAKAHINKSFDRLQATTGLTDVPTGWFAGGMPLSTKRARAEVHRERGVPLLYCSDTYGADTPYWVKDPYAAVHGGEDQGMLMVPYSLCTNDHRCTCCRAFPFPSFLREMLIAFVVFVAQGPGVSKPDDWFDLLKSEFDQLYEEGQNGTPKMMCVLVPACFVVPDLMAQQDRRDAQPLCVQAGAHHGAEEVHGVCGDQARRMGVHEEGDCSALAGALPLREGWPNRPDAPDC